jgi:hypothetical protein
VRPVEPAASKNQRTKAKVESESHKIAHGNAHREDVGYIGPGTVTRGGGHYNEKGEANDHKIEELCQSSQYKSSNVGRHIFLVNCGFRIADFGNAIHRRGTEFIE